MDKKKMQEDIIANGTKERNKMIKEFEIFIKQHNLKTYTNTPDSVLAEYFMVCFDHLNIVCESIEKSKVGE